MFDVSVMSRSLNSPLKERRVTRASLKNINTVNDLDSSLENGVRESSVFGTPVSESTPVALKDSTKKNLRITRSLISEEINQDNSTPQRIKTSRPSRETVSSDSGLFDVSSLRNSLPSVPPVVLRSRHPLPSSWTFWFFRASPSLSWEDNQTKLASINTIEDFWQVFNLLKPASHLSPGQDYSLFRGGMFPDWSVGENWSGGRWILRLSEGRSLDKAWLELLCMLLGEQLGARVNGCVASVRPGVGNNKLSVWLKDTTDMGEVVKVGRMVKGKLDTNNLSRIKFSFHRDARERAPGAIREPDLYL